eukprot:1269301-Rhodomonas_salina.1
MVAFSKMKQAACAVLASWEVLQLDQFFTVDNSCRATLHALMADNFACVDSMQTPTPYINPFVNQHQPAREHARNCSAEVRGAQGEGN